jgi:hypothetical protein
MGGTVKVFRRFEPDVDGVHEPYESILGQRVDVFLPVIKLSVVLEIKVPPSGVIPSLETVARWEVATCERVVLGMGMSR